MGTQLAKPVDASLTNRYKGNNMNTIQKESLFHYRTIKDKETGMETKRPTEKLTINYPVVSDLVAQAQQQAASEDENTRKIGEKSLELLQAAVNDVIDAQARTLLDSYSAIGNVEISKEPFPFEQLNWDFIATIPPAQRRGGGIASETWDAFIEDYKAVMPALTGKDQERIDKAAALLKRKLAPVKTSKDHLKFFQQQLALYATSESAADYVDCLEYLDNKIKDWLSMDTATILESL